MSNNTLGGILWDARKAKHLSRAALAALTGVGTTAIADIETGRTPNPGYLTAAKLAEAVGLAVLCLPIDALDGIAQDGKVVDRSGGD